MATISTLPFGTAIAQPGMGPETFDIQTGGSLSYALGGIGVDVNLATGFADRGIATGDILLNSSQAANFTLYGSDVGADKLAANNMGSYLFGGGARDTLIGGAGNDTLNGGYGSDTAPYNQNLNGDSTPYVPNSGSDTVDYSGAGAAVTVNLGSITDDTSGLGNTVGTATGSTIGSDILISIENVVGSAFNDTITGNGTPNISLFGGAGNDTLDGGAGTAIDTLAGGAGNDVFYVRRTGDTVVELASQGTDRVLSFVDYTLTANVEQLTLQGTANLNGTGNDLINTIIGNTGANVLLGLGGNDVLTGDSSATVGGNDSINGGAANDVITGGIGADTLTGETGSDKFVYIYPANKDDSLLAAYDVITDFTVSGTANLNDKFRVAVLPTLVTNLGTINTNLATAVAGINFTNAYDSVVFTLGSGGGQFVTINDGTAGAFDTAKDTIVQLAGTSSLVSALLQTNFSTSSNPNSP